MANQVAQISMQKLVTGMRSNPSKGFTLIEILVVVLIIGITLGFALLAFGDFGSKRRIVMAAEQFVNYVKLVQQQAIVETSTLGISINQNSYQVLRFQTPSNWQLMPQKSIFHQQRFPDNAIVHIDQPAQIKGTPQIIINASGDMTAFKLNFGSAKDIDIATVVADHNGTVALQLATSP